MNLCTALVVFHNLIFNIHFIIISAVLWSGAFVRWIDFLTRDGINLRIWTDCKLYYFLFRFGRHYSSMLLVLMSVEKCMVLYFPLSANKLCTVKTAKYVTGIVGIILSGYDFQYLIMFEASVDEHGLPDCEFQITYESILRFMDAVLYSFLPFVLMFLTNFAIAFKFMRAKCISNQTNSTESTSQALQKAATRGTAMVVTVSVTFLILTAPTAVYNVLHTSDVLRRFPFYKTFMNLAQYLNHSINGFLYCVVGSKFRVELFKIFCRKKNLKDFPGFHSVKDTSASIMGSSRT